VEPALDAPAALAYDEREQLNTPFPLEERVSAALEEDPGGLALGYRNAFKLGGDEGSDSPGFCVSGGAGARMQRIAALAETIRRTARRPPRPWTRAVTPT
jgi:hypothetical protein